MIAVLLILYLAIYFLDFLLINHLLSEAFVGTFHVQSGIPISSAQCTQFSCSLNSLIYL